MGSKKILIVDDDKDLLLGLNIRLKAAGYAVILAADAPSAISKATRENPDLIILDIGLPGGDGFLIMERLNSPQMNIHIPTIVLTARDATTARKSREGSLPVWADNDEPLTLFERL
jgi:DNA-binding response OmpR family regulator